MEILILRLGPRGVTVCLWFFSRPGLAKSRARSYAPMLSDISLLIDGLARAYRSSESILDQSLGPTRTRSRSHCHGSRNLLRCRGSAPFLTVEISSCTTSD